MASPKRKEPDDTGEIKVKDFALAKKLYFGDIKPAKSAAAESMQEASTAYKAIKKDAHIQPGAAKAAFNLVEMEDAKRDDWLRCFMGVLRENNIDPDPADLVDVMQADDGYARPKPTLVTLADPEHPDDDSDLADPSGEEPTSGTGAAALAAMRAAARSARTT